MQKFKIFLVFSETNVTILSDTQELFVGVRAIIYQIDKGAKAHFVANVFYLYGLYGTNRAFFIKATDKTFALYDAVLNPNNTSRSIQVPQKKATQAEKNTEKQKSGSDLLELSEYGKSQRNH